MEATMKIETAVSATGLRPYRSDIAPAMISVRALTMA
jgi:hypothetical protein